MTFSSISVVCCSLWLRRYMWSQLTDLLQSRVQKVQDLLKFLPHPSCYRLYKSVWCQLPILMLWDDLLSPHLIITQQVTSSYRMKGLDLQTLKSVHVIKCLG
jgi:hypothetical protein